MKTFMRALSAFVAGLGLMLLAVPVASAGDLTALDEVREKLAPYGDNLEIAWRDDALVLDGELTREEIEQVVLTAARVDGVDTIVNELYV